MAVQKEKVASTPVRDVNQTVRYLTKTFNMAISGLDRAARTKTGPNKAYQLQTEFAYLLNEVMQGPNSTLSYNIQLCNEFIDKTLTELSADSK